MGVNGYHLPLNSDDNYEDDDLYLLYSAIIPTPFSLAVVPMDHLCLIASDGPLYGNRIIAFSMAPHFTEHHFRTNSPKLEFKCPKCHTEFNEERYIW